jgi:cell surface protein SprA
LSNSYLALFASVFTSLVLAVSNPGAGNGDLDLKSGPYDVNYSLADELIIPSVPVDTPPPNPYTGPGDPTTWDESNPLNPPLPSNVVIEYELAEDGKGFYVHEKVGEIEIREPSYITLEEYAEMRKKQGMDDYWANKSASSTTIQNKGLLPSVPLPKGIKSIFGDSPVEIRPNGMALIDLGAEFNRMQNPSLPIRQQRTGNFRFDQQIQLNVVGKIGDKLRLNANWDTQSTFEFENQINLKYAGNEDEILQILEAGNVSLPLNGSLINGGQNLFGIKAAFKFGPLTVTTVASQQKGKTQTVTATGGAQVTTYEKKGNEYDEYRHFFLSHYFRSRYEKALSNLPVINSNGLQLTRVEVWMTNNNSSSTTNNRNAVGFIDLGESEVPPNASFIDEVGNVFNPQWAGGGITQFPDNQANGLYDYINARAEFQSKATVDSALVNQLNLVQGVDFEKIENMRRLNDNEFTFHPQLGYMSLNTALQANQVCYVAYEYMLNGQTFQVGDFSNDPAKQANELNSNVLFLKMIKPSSVRPVYGTGQNPETFPTWNLMMKNIYSIGGYGLKRDNFKLEIKFDSRSAAGTISYIPEGPIADQPLLQVFELDNLTNNNQSQPDNVFDFIEMISIVPEKGLIIFPLLEPFGSNIKRKMNNVAELVEKYSFPELYSKTRRDAINYFPHKDRFSIKGSYQGSSSSEISLNSINVAPGSVKVTANGTQLVENQDYTVDYNIGKVKILNSGILSSGQEIKVSFETNSLFGIDSKTLVGARFDYQVNKDFLLGGTVLHLNERPLTAKIVIGDEPVSNTIWGLDGTIRKDSRFITKLVDALPLLQTKEMSNVTMQGEFAQLVPGHPKAIAVEDEKGIGYLEDFESAKTTFDLMGYRAWSLAAFPGDNGFNNITVPALGWKPALSTGFTRGKLAWYQIDQSFYYQSQGEVVPEADLSNNYTRQVTPREVFPNQTRIVGDNLQRTFDLYYQPTLRGPYNFQVDPSKVNPDGTFSNPEENWAGITRRTGTNTDFEASNFEFIEFWLMDPFITNPGNDGELFIDLGRISEDVLKDNFRSFENGLPSDPANLTTVQESDWARVPVTNPPTNAFNNDAAARQYQDVGLDGVWDDEEVNKFRTYLDSLGLFLNPDALSAITGDPSTDNYHYFRGEDFSAANNGLGTGIRKRYENFNNSDGNTPIDATVNGYSTQGSPSPDSEDLNSNGTLNTTEEYYEYKMRLNPNEMTVGRNFIVDVIPAEVTLVDGTTSNLNWYQFRIPLIAGEPINGIQNFKAIEFVRMYLKGWEDEVTMRFAKLQLVSTSWRTYRDYLGAESDTTILEPPTDLTTFEIGTVNIEENSNRTPFNYVLPPKVQRQQQFNSPQTNLLQNEQALVMKTCNLLDGDARGAFKLTTYDLRSYVNLRMWVHAEDVLGELEWQDGDLAAFVRLGSDNSQNYYEYEIPLKHSLPNDQDSNNIWLNEFNFDLEQLNVVKGVRNDSVWPVTNRFTMPVDPLNLNGDQMGVVGTPQLSNIKTIMIGLRNRKNGGDPICAEVWVNELRVTNFREQAGEAVTARLNVKLADWGNVTLSGSMRTPGFGSLEQKINTRSREELKQFDVAGNFQMGKFFPKKWGIELPVYLTYGKRVVTPQYNPLESDVPMEELLNTIEDSARRELFRQSVQDYSENKSISFNNIRKVRVAPVAGSNPGKGPGPGGPKTHPWDIANFSISYSYSENFNHNATVQSNLQTTHRGAFAYAYTFTNKPWEPFKKAKKKNIITGFNFNPFPKQMGFSVNGDRQFTENIMRATAGQDTIDATYNKNFLVTRNYNLRWDFTKGLSLNFTAANISRVDEPFGRLDTEAKKDSMINNLFYRGPLTDSSGQYISVTTTCSTWAATTAIAKRRG